MMPAFSKTILWSLLILAVLVISGCGVAIRSDVVMAEPAVMMDPTQPVAEKVVTLVPQSVQQPLTNTPTPYLDPAFVPSPTPPSFMDFGVTPAVFRDEFSGVSFSYPSHWLVNDLSLEQKQNSSIYTVSLRAPMPEQPPKQQEGPLPEGVAALDISIWQNQVSSYEEAVAMRLQQHRESEMPSTILSQTDIQLADGLPATRFELDTRNGRLIEVVAFTRTGVLLIDGFGDLTLFDTILSTLRTE